MRFLYICGILIKYPNKNFNKMATTVTKFEKGIVETKLFDMSPSKKKQRKNSTDSKNNEGEETKENHANKEHDEEDVTKMLAELSYKTQFHEVEKMIPYGLTFDDVLMIPQYSRVNSRQDIELETRFSKNVPLRIPLVSSPMDTVTEYDMAVAMARQGGLGIIHRFMSIKDQAEMVTRVIDFVYFNL